MDSPSASIELVQHSHTGWTRLPDFCTDVTAHRIRVLALASSAVSVSSRENPHPPPHVRHAQPRPSLSPLCRQVCLRILWKGPRAALRMSGRHLGFLPTPTIGFSPPPWRAASPAHGLSPPIPCEIKEPEGGTGRVTGSRSPDSQRREKKGRVTGEDRARPARVYRALTAAGRREDGAAAGPRAPCLLMSAPGILAASCAR
ncbi:Hypothetical predicted protein [Pelobates cultripes]|uniref:Uncharacterized protein n=1 Tax=Pelobates cultripes TaxID=61616 RepID=A0AAD1VQQ2_PELCU|nr:Hypothetical predicted protein [Pelobates cultripes]